MRSQDKNNLIISAVLIGIILLIAVIWTGTRYLPFIGVVGVSLIVELFYCMPSVCKKYYEWIGESETIHWIPFVNVIQCFNSVIAISSIVLTVIAIFCLFFLKLPSAIHKIFGENFMVDYGDTVFYYGILFLLIESILWGIGYIKIFREAKSSLSANTITSTLADMLFMLTLFIPFIRVIGLLNLNNTLDAALNVVEDDYDDEFEEVEYDE